MAFLLAAPVLAVPVLVAGVHAGARADAQTVAPLAIATTSLPAVETGEHLAIPLRATGGKPPYSWQSAPLPPGVTLGSGGVLTGAPTVAGTAEVAVTALDATGARATATFALVVGPGPVVTTTALPEAQAEQPYSTTLTATGGTPPYTWIVPYGGIPGGLVLSSSGVLSGRPGRAGRYRIDLGVSDAVGGVGRLGFTLVVLPSPTPPPPPPPQGYVTVDAAGRTTTSGMVAPASTARTPGSTVAVAAEPSGAGYWTVSTTGAVHAFGAAPFHGSVGRRYLDARIVGIAARPGGAGYWVVSAVGHVYGFGADHSLGSLPPGSLEGTVVGIAAALHGRGYWIATSSGQVFGFGTARGAMTSPVMQLPGGIVGIAASTTGDGFYVVDASGVVEGVGAASVQPGRSGPVVGTVVGIAVPPATTGPGYWLLTSTGAVLAYGAASVPPAGARSTPAPLTVPPRGIAGAR